MPLRFANTYPNMPMKLPLPKSLHFLCFIFLCTFLLLLITFNNTKIAIHLPRDHAADVAHHPLDPLTISEVNRVKIVVSSHPLFGGAAFVSVALEEPPKPEVLRWRIGDALPRRKAAVIARHNSVAHVLSVDLDTGRVSELDNVGTGTGYPVLTIEDTIGASKAPLTSEEFNRSVMARGMKLVDLICIPYSPGWFGEKEEGRRLAKVQCFSTEDTVNYYLRPIEGLTVLVDLDTNQVIQISDHGRSIPIPKAANTEYRFSKTRIPKTRPINPISMDQPKGPSFTVENNHFVTWANWEFHLKPDPRAGLVISRVKVVDPDTGELRNVMYKGMISELFVPYMDPTESWYFKTYMDAGAYGFQAKILDPLNDCPKNAQYMDGVFAALDGTPYVASNIICVFERYTSDISWRHFEDFYPDMKILESRPKITLVIRMIAVIGHYDYIVDWEFQADGVIKIKVGLTGIAAVKGTEYKNMNQVPKEEDLYGTLVSDNIIGIIHDHLMSFYLDMDIDGPNNSFVKLGLQRQHTLPNESPRRSYIKAVRHIAETEKDAQIKLNIYNPSEFHIINSNKKTQTGNPVGYKLVPGANAASLLSLDDPPQKIAGFTNNQIWVTPYNATETWSGGFFVYQSQGEDNLAQWSKRDRAIKNKDIVLWYTLGFHHVTCQEDFPIMSTVSSFFELKPVNFFARNPILGIPPFFE